MSRPSSYHFFFNDTASTVIYTLSLHDALPIFHAHSPREAVIAGAALAREVDADHLLAVGGGSVTDATDRKSTRLNSSHLVISYAVFCLKKKKIQINKIHTLDYVKAIHQTQHST